MTNKIRLSIYILSIFSVANAGMNNLLHCKLGYLEGARDEVVDMLDEEIGKLQTLKKSNIESVQKMNMILKDASDNTNSWQGPIKDLLNEAKNLDLSQFEMSGGLDLSELNPLKKYGDAIKDKVEATRNKTLSKINSKVSSLNEKIKDAQKNLNDKLQEFSDGFADGLNYKIDLDTSDITKWTDGLAGDAGYVSPDFGLKTNRPNFDMCNLDKSIEDLIASCKSVSDSLTGKSNNSNKTNNNSNSNSNSFSSNTNNNGTSGYLKKKGIQIDKIFSNNNTDGTDGDFKVGDISNINNSETINKIQNQEFTQSEATKSYSTAEGKCQILENYKQQLEQVKQQLLDYSKQLILNELEKLLAEFVGLQQIMEVQQKIQCTMKATADAATNMGALAVGYEAMAKCLDGADEAIETGIAGDVGVKMASVPVGPIVVPIPFSQISMSPNTESNALDAAASTASAVGACMGEGYGAGWTKAYKDCMEGKSSENSRMESLNFDLNFKFLDDLKDFKKQKCIMDKKVGEDFSVVGNLKEIAGNNFDHYKSAYEDILKMSKDSKNKIKEKYASSRDRLAKVSESFGEFYKDFYAGTSNETSYISLHERTVKKIYGEGTDKSFIFGLLYSEPVSYINDWNKNNSPIYNKIKPEDYEMVYLDNQLNICKNRMALVKPTDRKKYTNNAIKLIECQVYLENLLIAKISDIYVFEKEPLYIDSNLIQKDFLLRSIFERTNSNKLRKVSYKNLKKFYGIKE